MKLKPMHHVVTVKCSAFYTLPVWTILPAATVVVENIVMNWDNSFLGVQNNHNSDVDLGENEFYTPGLGDFEHYGKIPQMTKRFQDRSGVSLNLLNI